MSGFTLYYRTIPRPNLQEWTCVYTPHRCIYFQNRSSQSTLTSFVLNYTDIYVFCIFSPTKINQFGNKDERSYRFELNHTSHLNLEVQLFSILEIGHEMYTIIALKSILSTEVFIKSCQSCYYLQKCMAHRRPDTGPETWIP